MRSLPSKKIYFLCLCFLSFSLFSQTVSSPNGRLSLLFLLEEGKVFYTLSYDGKAVVDKSRLGLRLKGGEHFLDAFEKTKETRDTKNETWKPIMGEKKEYINHYNELAITLYQKKQDRHIVIRFRVFNDGLGMRYEFPQQKNLNYFVIEEEDTEFKLPSEDHTAWWISGDYDTQEYRFVQSNLSEVRARFKQGHEDNVSQFPLEGAVQTPLMLKRNTDGFYINIAEAAVIAYPTSHLEVDEKNMTLKTHLTPSPIKGSKAFVQTPFNTPWRTVIASPKAEEVMASKLIFNLNEPTAYKDVSWIKPTKYIGVWWQMFVPHRGSWSYTHADNIHLGVTDYSQLAPNGMHAANNENVKRYIDFAAKHGFDAILVEGWDQGWEDWFGKYKEFVFDFVSPYPDFDIKMLNQYAQSKGVRLLMHHETSGAATNYERWMDTAFKLMKEHGYNAVKTGYVGDIIPRGEHHYGQWMIEHYLRVVKKAAEYNIMINSHESVRPTGLNRTYPNWIAAEAARGTEYEVFSGMNPDHTTILPFTRLMGGPMDYTPGIFQTQISYYDKNDTRFVKSTLVKQLALYVTMYSPLQMAADLPENYERHMDAFQFIKDVAVDWDDTKILSAEPGDYIHIARKAKGINKWFLGGITDENAREYALSFSFLQPKTEWLATFYEDGDDADYIKNPQSYKISKRIVNDKSRALIKMASSGGYAISLEPASKEDVKKYAKTK